MPPPANPASSAGAVSGPGKFSQRTDGGRSSGKQPLATLPDAKYGEQSAFKDLQQGAPLAQTNQPPTPSPGELPPNPAAQAVVPFSAPTQNPDQPVTHGAAAGAGAGPEALGLNPAQAEQQDMSQSSQYLPLLEFVANQPNSSPSSRLFINLLKANS